MKAVVVTRYGGPEVLHVKDVPKPTPQDHEVLINIRAAAVNSTDPVFRKGRPLISRLFSGVLKPKHAIPGDVLAGEIVDLGGKVTTFAKGDRVYGYSTERLGVHAEFLCLPDTAAICAMPENIDFEQAAGIVDGGLTALVFLRDNGRIDSAKRSFSECKKALKEDGIYLTTFPSASVFLHGLCRSRTVRKRALFVAAGMRPTHEKIRNLNDLSDLIRINRVKTVIDKTYTLDAIADAHRHVETGHKKGNVVITL